MQTPEFNFLQSAQINGKPVVIFCDYDGTITQKDVIGMVMQAFAPPEFETIMHDVLKTRTMTIADGVKKLFAMIPSAKRESIETFVKTEVKFRDGFADFLSFCKTQQILFNVVSGGVDFLIQPKLAELSLGKELPVYCNQAHFKNETITLTTKYAPNNCVQCNNCSCCKQTVMDLFPKNTFKVAIGDSLSDIGMIQKADLVFARCKLLDYAKDLNVEVVPFDSFDEIQQHLAQLMIEKKTLVHL